MAYHRPSSDLDFAPSYVAVAAVAASGLAGLLAVAASFDLERESHDPGLAVNSASGLSLSPSVVGCMPCEPGFEGRETLHSLVAKHVAVLVDFVEQPGGRLELDSGPGGVPRELVPFAECH